MRHRPAPTGRRYTGRHRALAPMIAAAVLLSLFCWPPRSAAGQAALTDLCTSSDPGAVILALSGTAEHPSCTRLGIDGPATTAGTGNAAIIVYREATP